MKSIPDPSFKYVNSLQINLRKTFAAASRNGAAWVKDCLLKSTEMTKAAKRLEMACREGRRHSAPSDLQLL